jgi:hypothetical protein
MNALTGRGAPRSHRGAGRLAPLDSARHGGWSREDHCRRKSAVIAGSVAGRNRALHDVAADGRAVLTGAVFLDCLGGAGRLFGLGTEHLQGTG